MKSKELWYAFLSKSFHWFGKNMSVLADKSYAFSIRIVKCSTFLQKEQKEFVLSKQLLRSGTAIGALIAEEKYAQSKSDFINKLSVTLKEANETKYWLRLLTDCVTCSQI